MPVAARIALGTRRSDDVGMPEDVRMRRARLLAVVTAALAIALDVYGVLGMLDLVHNAELNSAPPGIAPFFLASVAAPAIVGLLVALRRPTNRIAWLLLLGGLSTSPLPAFFLSDGWTIQAERALWPMLYAWPIAVAYVFPDGHFLSRRWRRAGIAGFCCFTLFMALAMFDPSPLDDNPAIKNPMAGNAVGQALVDTGIWIPLWIGILVSLIGGAVAIRLRLRRSTGLERLQTLWLAWAACLVPLGLFLCGMAWVIAGVDVIVYPFLLTTQAVVAVAVGVAVARYHLFAIERLINRTIVYAVLTVLLGATYAMVSLGLGVVVGRGTQWATAAATLAVALAFRPLRARVQSRVDRRFDRARVEAVRQVHAFEDDVREGRREPEEVGTVIAAALGDPDAELLFWLPASEAYANAAGELVDAPIGSGLSTEVRRDGALIAVVRHSRAVGERRALLEAVLSAASLSIEIARLRVEVRRQLAEVDASRRRIVEAGYEERRRLERDLHDGAQQRLVTLGIELRRLQRSLPRGSDMLRPALDGAVAEIGAAVTDLRTIAAGVRPPRLDDGLASALRDLARTAPLPVTVQADIDRVAASVEAAAYFVACEGLTNAVKHASASRVQLHAARQNGSLHLTVSDDGVGGATARRGSGLAGLRDRIAAHGGAFELVSPHGEGTRIEVTIPCES
jgi:signal transduction histidine kinase